MNTGLERAWFKFALVALLAVGGLTDAALAQELDASRAALTGSHETQTNAFSARNAKAVPSVGKFRAAEATPAPEIVKLPGFSHQAAGARVETDPSADVQRRRIHRERQQVDPADGGRNHSS